VPRFSLLSAVGWSLTWAVGAAIGVALGAYLTVLGASAAPGDVALDSTELLLLPAIAAGVVFAVSLLLRIGAALVRRVLSARQSGGKHSNDHDEDGDSIAQVD